MIWKPEEARRVLDRAIKMSRSKDVVGSVGGGLLRNTRFAVNEITSTGESEDVELSIRVAFGKRHGQSSTNQFDDASLRRCVESAEEMAELSPEDPEHMPALAQQKYVKPTPAAYDGKTAAFDADGRAHAVATCLEPANAAKLTAAGFIETREHFSSILTSAGCFAYDQRTGAEVSCTFRTKDGTGSGWGVAAANRVADIDFGRVARTATDKAQRSQQPTKLDPGEYTVVLEPAAVSDMLSFLIWSLDQRSADEGRSFFSKAGGGTRIGEKLLGPFTLMSDPADSLDPGIRFDGEGLPTQRIAWFEAGELKNLRVGRYWAQKTGKQPTGAAANVILRGNGPTATTEEMIKSIDRGVLVTRFWYVRYLEPERISITGLTRDGTFLIEGGQIKRPVKNFRFNQEVVACLGNAEMWSQPVRVRSSESSGPTAVPAIKAKGFHFASISDAV